LPKKISHASLPGGIVVAYEPLKTETTGGDRSTSESITGALLLKKMASHYLEGSTLDVFTPRNEKPQAFLDGEEISVSFSHTDDAIVAAISRTYNVGIDMEHSERVVHERLAPRMKAKHENSHLYSQHPLIQIWTFKEAALKMIGTGLRKPMNSVQIDPFDEFIYEAQFDNGRKAKICSFNHQEHWVSICYENNAIP
jgi:phosphopantetheinyl transferase